MIAWGVLNLLVIWWHSALQSHSWFVYITVDHAYQDDKEVGEEAAGKDGYRQRK